MTDYKSLWEQKMDHWLSETYSRRVQQPLHSHYPVGHYGVLNVTSEVRVESSTGLEGILQTKAA